MASTHRPRRRLLAALAAGVALTLAACTSDTYPNSTFHHTTEFNESIDFLWDRLLFWGTIVFLLVETMLVYTIIKFRGREGQSEPKHVHGNTTLEILWTAIPALILVFIAVPTVRTIFRTQAKAAPNALQVEVIGHQWWWEFRYPQYGVTTANELYLPTGRTVNFALKSADVVHSFWIPRLGGKRDVVTNHTNYLWFTPKDSMALKALNGSCNEYCGASHANMKFRAFTVPPAEFESWIAHQKTPAAFGAVARPAAPGAPTGAAPAGGTTAAQSGGTVIATAAQGTPAPQRPQGGTGDRLHQPTAAQPGEKETQAQPLGPAAAGATAARTPAQGSPYVFPRERFEKYNVPTTPVPTNVRFPSGLQGDAARGQQIYSRSACIACHYIEGNPMSVGKVGPNLTHIGSRYTIASAQYPNSPEYMARWIKNARALKPGSLMPTLGQNETDPITKQRVTVGGLTDQQIADIVAYLQALQ